MLRTQERREESPWVGDSTRAKKKEKKRLLKTFLGYSLVPGYPNEPGGRQFQNGKEDQKASYFGRLPVSCRKKSGYKSVQKTGGHKPRKAPGSSPRRKKVLPEKKKGYGTCVCRPESTKFPRTHERQSDYVLMIGIRRGIR